MTQSAIAGSLEDILGRTRAVPPVQDFPGVDELLASFVTLEDENPQLIASRRIGTSRLGEPISMYSVGHGRRQYLLFAGVHPNEPIGFRTLQHLAAELVRDEALRDAFDATWHIVPCIDPDGTRLNEAWYSSPTDRTFYARHFYRPAPNEQVEWTFPFAYREAWFDSVMPETLALMRVIDEVQPQLMVSLHNAEMGGVYYYLSDQVEGGVDALHAIASAVGLPLDTGEPESPAIKKMAPAVYEMISMADEYEFIESLGADPTTVVTGGDSSASYAAKYGTLSVVAELPYWEHPDADDDSLTESTYGAVLHEKADAFIAMGTTLQGVLDEADLTLNTPFRRASEAFVPFMVTNGEHEHARAEKLSDDRFATRAEVFSNNDVVRCFKLRYGGMVLRALDAEVVAGTATANTRRAHLRMTEIFEGWCEEARSLANLTVIPVEKLIGVQYGATLAMARCLIDSEAP